MASRQMSIHCDQCTMREEHFNALSKEELGEIDDNRTELVYKKGEILYKQGAFISKLIFIRSGLVKLYVDSNNSTSILFLKDGGSFIGLPSLYGDEVHQYSAEALLETRVCEINFSIIKKLLTKNCVFGTDVIKMINKDLSIAFDRISSFSNKQLHGRLAELLLYLEADIYKSNPFKLTLTKTDLANMLSTSKESVSRLMSSLKKDQIIEERKHNIHIINPDRLRRISETG